MAVYTLFCPICGARTTREDHEDPNTPKNWLSDIKILYLNVDEQLRSSIPFILSETARIPDAEGGWPEVFDPSTGTYTSLASELFRNDGTRADSYCYPIHERCLSLIRETVAICGIDEFPPDVYGYLFTIFSDLPYDWHQIYWPHEYDGISEYQRAVSLPGARILPRLEYVEASPVEVQYLRGKVDEERDGYLAETTESADDTNTTIPDFLPLPIELVQQIMGFLDWSDISNLQKIESERVIDLPDMLWREYFSVAGEFGFFGYQEHDTSVESWYQLYNIAKRLVKREIPGIKNRERIWRLCLETFIFFMHYAIEESVGIEATRTANKSEILEVEDRTALLSVQATSQEVLATPTLFDGMPTRHSGSLTDVVATGMHVSFKGTGRLRFVSGFKFMPSETSIGNLNRFDNQYVSFESANLDETLVMHVAASKYGVVDMSVVSSQSANPQPKWIGECDLTGCAITRWSIKTGGSAVIFSKIIVDLNAISMTNLQILRPSFMPSPVLTPEDIFIQENPWKPNIPVLAANNSLNHELFYRSERSSPLAGERTSNYVQAEFDPLECICGDETITRLSFWSTGLYNDICAIEVYTKEHATPHVVGTPMGSATDIFIDGEGGEYISHMSVIVVESNGQIIGLTLSTSYDRKFNLSFQNEGKSGWLPGKEVATCMIDLGPKNGAKIIGIYCRFSQRRVETTLLDIGVITTKHEGHKRPTWFHRVNAEPEPVNTQLIPFYKQMHDKSPRGRSILGNGWRFVSKTPIKGCTRVVAHLQSDPPFRLSGICIYYDGVAHPGLPVVLGQIGHATITETMNLSPSEGEIITIITVFYKAVNDQRPFRVVGLRIQTSKARDSNHHRRQDLGDCKDKGEEPREVGKLKVEEFDSLQWEYTEYGDYLSLPILR
ncbi:hypothetical protein TWF281_001519 [Arthrobotrys megalospora]